MTIKHPRHERLDPDVEASVNLGVRWTDESTSEQFLKACHP